MSTLLGARPNRAVEPSRTQSGAACATDPDFSELVLRIAADDPSAIDELYRLLCRGIRFLLARQVGWQGADDKVHDTLVIVVQAIQKGTLRDPQRLMGFVQTVVRRQVTAHIGHAVRNRNGENDRNLGALPDHRDNPEESLEYRQKIELMKSVLRQLSAREQEILTRFYLHEQTPERICEEMSLTQTQFRLLKSKAKARFGELGKRRSAGSSRFLRYAAEPRRPESVGERSLRFSRTVR